MDLRNLTVWLHLTIAAALIVACGKQPTLKERTQLLSCTAQKAALPAKAHTGPADQLIVAMTDYSVGELAKVELTHRMTQELKAPIHSDAIVRSPLGSPYYYVVNRLGADNLQLVDKESGETVSQCSVGKGTNPQDIAVINPHLAYVSRYRSSDLIKLDPSTGRVLGTFSLAQAADADGYPEMAWMAVMGNKLVVELQRLDTLHGFVPTDHSMLALIDLATDSVSYLTLKRTNPSTPIRMGTQGEWLVGETGVVGVKDGGIESFSLDSWQSRGLISTEAQLGGDIVDFGMLSDKVGVAIVSAPNTKLVSFSATDGSLQKVILDPGSYTLQQIVVDSNRGVFYVADRDPRSPGIRTFALSSLSEIASEHFSLPLPPYQMELTN